MKSNLTKYLIFIFILLNLSCTDDENPVVAINNAPVVTIVTPPTIAVFYEGDTIAFTATAVDLEDGELTDSSLVWTSDIDGQIGMNELFLISSLSVNTHKIILTATDSKGDIGSDTTTVYLYPNKPIASITSPLNHSEFINGDTITFVGTGIDKEDGILTDNSLVWTSDIDGQLGVGRTFSTNSLSFNSHIITLNATDSDNNIGTVKMILSIELFEKSFGGTGIDIGTSVVETSDGGFVITGFSTSFGDVAAGSNIYIIKTNKSGAFLWEKTINKSYRDTGSDILETSEGGLIITGSTAETGYYDVYIIKIDKNGTLVWERTIDFAGDDVSYSIIEISDGGFLLTGFTGEVYRDVYLIKIDNNGTPVWEKSLGGTQSDLGKSVVETSDGGFIITGNTHSFGAEGGDVYLMKTDNSGTLLWEKTFGGIEYDIGNSVVESSDGGLIIIGYTYSNATGGYDVYLIKTDNNGTLVWEKTFGGASDDRGYSAIETLDGSIMIAASTHSLGAGGADVYIIKTDETGTLIWEKTFGGVRDDYGYSIIETSDGGYIITGSESSTKLGDDDVYLLKIDSDGNIY